MQLGQTLRLDLVAEGIESADELAALEGLGVHYGQGYHLGRPVPSAAHGTGEPLTERRTSTSRGAALHPAPLPRSAATVAP